MCCGAPPDLNYELPPLPPLCCTRENTFCLPLRSSQFKHPVQFPLVGNPLLQHAPFGTLHHRHQVLYQCSCVHFPTSELDSYHGTRTWLPATGFRPPAPGPRFLPADISPPSSEPELPARHYSCAGTPAGFPEQTQNRLRLSGSRLPKNIPASNP